MPPRPETAADELLTREFQARLLALRERFFRRLSLGEQRGRGFGPTPEFDTHRSYEPGDDLRYIDWNLYARTERLLLKVFTVEEDSRVCVLLDTSASMRLGRGAKERMAARFAAAFAYLALAAGRPLEIGAFAQGLIATEGPLRSLARFPGCQRFFAAPPRGEATRLGPSLAELVGRARGRLFLIVVSDFLQEGDVGREIAWLRGRKHDLHLVQVLDDADLAPTLRGACTVADAEGPEAVALFAGRDVQERLRALIRKHLEDLEASCRSLAVPLARVRSSQPFERAFLGHLEPVADR